MQCYSAGVTTSGEGELYHPSIAQSSACFATGLGSKFNISAVFLVNDVTATPFVIEALRLLNLQVENFLSTLM